MTKSKEEIRKSVMNTRNRIPKLMLEQRSGIICKKVTQLPEYQNAETVYAYVPLDREVSTIPLIEAAWADGKRVAVPQVIGDGRMRFVVLNDWDQLEEGHFHVREPKFGVEAEDSKALMIMPGVAFDLSRNRIGYGKGYYDRFLSQEPEHTTVALSFEFALFPEIPSEENDRKPDLIVTDQRLIGREVKR